MNKELLDALDQNGLVEVVFSTKGGSKRAMNCTRKLDEIQYSKRSGIDNPKLNAPLICCVFDWLNGDWRAFRWDSVISWEVVELGYDD